MWSCSQSTRLGTVGAVTFTPTPRARNWASIFVVAGMLLALFAPGAEALHLSRTGGSGTVISVNTTVGAQQTGTSVTITNSYEDEGEPEEVFEGPMDFTVGAGTDLEGFGGFDIDVSDDAITMTWSIDPEFDDYEGEFDDTYRDIFTFEFEDGDFTAEADNDQNLVPTVTQDGTTVRVVFEMGDVYANGRRAVVRLATADDTTAEAADSAADAGAEDPAQADAEDESATSSTQDDPATQDELPRTGSDASAPFAVALSLVLMGGFATIGARRRATKLQL